MRISTIVAALVTAGALLGAGLAPVAASAAPAAGATGAIEGRIWFDRNGDQQQDEGEPGWANRPFPVWLYTAAFEFVDWFPSDAKGGYRMENLAPGEYLVSHFEQGLFHSTTPINVTVVVEPDRTVIADFGVQGGSVSGTVWHDVDLDGQRGEGDPGLAGKPIRMDGPAGLVMQASTDAAGGYRFDDLPNGNNYHVTAPDLSGEDLTLVDRSWDSPIDKLTRQSDWMAVFRGFGHYDVGIGYLGGRPV